MSKRNYRLLDCEIALRFRRSLHTHFYNVVLVYVAKWKTKTLHKYSALTNFCRWRWEVHLECGKFSFQLCINVSCDTADSFSQYISSKYSAYFVV